MSDPGDPGIPAIEDPLVRLLGALLGPALLALLLATAVALALLPGRDADAFQQARRAGMDGLPDPPFPGDQSGIDGRDLDPKDPKPWRPPEKRPPAGKKKPDAEQPPRGTPKRGQPADPGAGRKP